MSLSVDDQRWLIDRFEENRKETKQDMQLIKAEISSLRDSDTVILKQMGKLSQEQARQDEKIKSVAEAAAKESGAKAGRNWGGLIAAIVSGIIMLLEWGAGKT